MTPQQTFVMADRALNAVVQQIQDTQWIMPMPENFHRAGQSSVPTLREIINHHAYDDAWMPDMVAGRTMDEVGRQTYDGDILGTMPRETFAKIVETACMAVSQLQDLDRPLHFSYGDWPARDGLWHVISFRGLRAYDIAVVMGVDPALPDELVQAMWDAFKPQAEAWRAMGVFGPEVTVSADSQLLDRLLGLTGRQPRS